MRVTILGHASLYFESGSERVLLDPILRTTHLKGSLGHQFPRVLHVERMSKPTLIVISHAHFDHFDPETLEALPKDVPVMVPTDKRMSRMLRDIGFTELLHLNTWESIRHGCFRFTATPSDAPVTEFGLLLEAPEGRLWQMSDAEPPPDTADRILAEYGAVDVVCTKFQPTDAQLNFQHNAGASFDRQAVAAWIETACACSPKFAFPYASALCFFGERSWLNRYAYPLSAEYVADLLSRRLAGVGCAEVVRPGDVITIAEGTVTREEQKSSFVNQAESEIRCNWEPFEESHLPGFADEADRRRAKQEITEVLLSDLFRNWVREKADQDSGPLRRFREWHALCQITVHLGDGERAWVQIDFTREPVDVREGETASATYFSHIGGRAAQRLLAGATTPLEVMLEGSMFIYERLIVLKDGRIRAPAIGRLYEEFPDPLLTFAGAHRRALADHVARVGA